MFLKSKSSNKSKVSSTTFALEQHLTTQIAIGMVLFPNLTQLDFTAPYEVFSRLLNAKIYLLAPTLDPIYSESGFPLLPNTSFERSPILDVLFVPGGLGVNAKLEDDKFLEFLKFQGDRARYVTSVASGSLLLAAAGLLQGYRATSHQFDLEFLPLLKVEAVRERVVCDRNRITGAGGTAGIDLGLLLATKLFGNNIAQEIQLWMEYSLRPTFNSDCLPTAIPFVVEGVQAQNYLLLEARGVVA